MIGDDDAKDYFIYEKRFEEELKNNFIHPVYKEKLSIRYGEKDKIKINYSAYKKEGIYFFSIKNIPYIYLNEEIKTFKHSSEWNRYRIELDILLSGQMVNLDVEKPIFFSNLKIYVENIFTYDTDCGKMVKVKFDIFLENKVLGLVVSLIDDTETFLAMLDIELDQISKKVFDKSYKSLTLEEKQLLSMYLN